MGCETESLQIRHQRLDEVAATSSTQKVEGMPACPDVPSRGRSASVPDALELSNLPRAESEAKSEFIAATDHELRTPLSSILGFAEWPAGGQTPLDERQARYVANIRSAGEHLIVLGAVRNQSLR